MSQSVGHPLKHVWNVRLWKKGMDWSVTSTKGMKHIMDVTSVESMWQMVMCIPYMTLYDKEGGYQVIVTREGYDVSLENNNCTTHIYSFVSDVNELIVNWESLMISMMGGESKVHADVYGATVCRMGNRFKIQVWSSKEVAGEKKRQSNRMVSLLIPKHKTTFPTMDQLREMSLEELNNMAVNYGLCEYEDSDDAMWDIFETTSLYSQRTDGLNCLIKVQQPKKAFVRHVTEHPTHAPSRRHNRK